jgi:hypothetical protein
MAFVNKKQNAQAPSRTGSPFAGKLSAVKNAASLDVTLVGLAFKEASKALSGFISDDLDAFAQAVASGKKRPNSLVTVRNLATTDKLKVADVPADQLRSRKLQSLDAMVKRAKGDSAFKARMERELLEPIAEDLRDEGFIDPKFKLTSSTQSWTAHERDSYGYTRSVERTRKIFDLVLTLSAPA